MSTDDYDRNMRVIRAEQRRAERMFSHPWSFRRSRWRRAWARWFGR